VMGMSEERDVEGTEAGEGRDVGRVGEPGREQSGWWDHVELVVGGGGWWETGELNGEDRREMRKSVVRGGQLAVESAGRQGRRAGAGQGRKQRRAAEERETESRRRSWTGPKLLLSQVTGRRHPARHGGGGRGETSCTLTEEPVGQQTAEVESRFVLELPRARDKKREKQPLKKGRRPKRWRRVLRRSSKLIKSLRISPSTRRLH